MKFEPLSCISIHSLHTEGDRRQKRTGVMENDFNPLPPHGGRLAPSRTCGTLVAFQSTPSTRRETVPTHRLAIYNPISIHSLHTEGDQPCYRRTSYDRYFNPLPPHGGRQCHTYQRRTRRNISIHSLHTEGDTEKAPKLRGFHISIHSLHTEGDQ